MRKSLLLVLVLLSVLAFGQSSIRLVQAPIKSAEILKPGEWRLILQKPSDLNLIDSIGFIVGLYSTSTFRNQNFATIQIESISENLITSYANTFDDIKPGDIVFLRNSLQDIQQFKGKLFLLGMKGIILNDNENRPYYSWSQIQTGNKVWEEQMLTKMLADIKGSGTTYTNEIEIGIDKGKKVSEGIERATLQVLLSFLTSMERASQVYAGSNLVLSKAYANWVQSGSIDYTIIDQFVKATNNPDFEKLKKAQLPFLTSDFIINTANGDNIVYSAGGSIEEYINTLQTISKLAVGILTNDNLGFIHFAFGSALHLNKQYQESLAQFELAAIAYKNNNEVQFARSISRQAECFEQLGDYEKSGKLFDQGVALWNTIITNDPSLYNYSRLRIVLEGLATSNEQLGKDIEYISTQTKLASVYTKLNLLSYRGNAFWNIGYTYGTKLKKAVESNQFYEKAYQVFDSVKGVSNAVTVLCNQAINFRSLKDYKSALELGLRAESYAKANLNEVAEGYALNNILTTYKAEDKTDKALEIALKMDRLYTNLNLLEKLGPVKDEIASLSDALGKSNEAIRAAEEAITIYQKLSLEQELADAYWNAGYYIGTKNNKIEDANTYYKNAFEYYKDRSTNNATTLLSNIAVNFRMVDEKDKSYAAHTEAAQYAIAKKDTTSIITALEKLYYTATYFKEYSDVNDVGLAIGKAYHAIGNDEKAIEWGNKVIEELDKWIELKPEDKLKATLAKSNIYEFLSEHEQVANMMYKAGDYCTNWPDAIQYYKKGLHIFLELQNNTQLLKGYHAMAKGYKSVKNADSTKIAEEAYSKLITTLPSKVLADHFSTLPKDEAGPIILSLPSKTQDEIIKEFEKAENVSDLSERLSAMESTAKLLNSLNRYKQAIAKYLAQNAIMPKKNDVYNYNGSPYGYADNLWDLGYAYSMIPDYKISNDYYVIAAGLYRKEKGWGNYVSLMNNIAINYRDAKDSTNTFRTHREAFKVLKSSNLTSEEYYFNALENAGSAYSHFENHGEAFKARREAALGFENLGKKEKAYKLFYDAGQSADKVKKYKEAETLYFKGLALADSLNDDSKRGDVYFRMAYNKGTYQLKSKEAIPIWEKTYLYSLQAGDTVDASIAQSNIGQEYWTLLDFDKAIENHYKAIDIATKGKYMKQVASSWRKLADLYKETKNPTKQAEAMSNAINFLEILKDTTELLPAYFDIGNSYNDSQETEKALIFYNSALSMAKAKNDSTNIAWAYYRTAGLYHARNPELAKANYEKTILLQKKIKDKENLIYTLASEGSLLIDSDRPQSEKLLNEALTIAKEINDNFIIAFCHTRLYSLYREIGKAEIAHQHMETALQLYKGLNNKVSLVDNYVTYANEYLYDYGDFEKTQAYMHKAKLLLDSIKNPSSLANFYAQQSEVYSDLGLNDEALSELNKAREICDELKNEWRLAGLYITYGNIYKSQNEYELSLNYQKKSDSLYRKLNVPYQCLAPIANIGGVYFAQGDYPKALDYFKRSLKILQDNKDLNTNLCKLLSSVGEVYVNMTNYEEAEKWLLQALETSKRIGSTRTEADIQIDLGKLKIETKKYEEAEKYLLAAKTFFLAQNLMVERTSNATFLGELYLKKGELVKAKIELDEAIALGEKFGKDAILWEGYFRMGDYYRQSKNLQEAKAYLLKSVGVIDKLRSKIVGGEEAQKLFSSDKWILEAYEELISVLLEKGETEEAMAWLQKINENNVRDKMRSMDVTFEDEEKNKTLAREKEMKIKLDAIEKQIAAQKQAKNTNTEQIKSLETTRNIAEGDYLKFVNQTVNVQPELSKYFSNTVQPSQLKGKKKQIPKDMALVSYLVGEKQLYIFVATSDTVVARIVAVTKEKIHRDVTAMTNITRSQLGNFGKIDLKSEEIERKEAVNQLKQTDQYLKPFEEAYNYLISPISGLIASKSRLGIIPTGELNYIPFQLLGKTLSNNKFSMLINQFSMFYTNSTDMLLRIADVDKSINILAFGNPDKTLPSTEKEVNDIKKIFPSAKVFVREEATEDKAKYASEEYNVMHFATHGNLDYEDFSKSYLTMASNVGKNEDGKLTLEELWGMDVMSHLNIVVLSACQTAVTKGSDESSPVSPASGFLQNGVKSVVATLWKVDDEATSILMNDFYTNIKTMDAVDAIRAAQTHISNIPKYNHPYYWGAMVLIGDWR